MADEEICAVLVTSAVPSHPSTALIAHVLGSLKKFCFCGSSSRVIVVSDGYHAVDGEKEKESYKKGKITFERAQAYESFRRNLDDSVAEKSPPFDIVASVVHLKSRRGFGGALLAGVELVKTPFCLVVQHDQLLVSHFPAFKCAKAMQVDASIKYIGAQSLTTLDYREKMIKRYDIDIGEEKCAAGDLMLTPLLLRYDKTHVCRTNELLLLLSALPHGAFPEDVLGHRQLADIKQNGMVAFPKYGTYVLNAKRETVYHLSGRRAVARPPEMTAQRTEDACPPIEKKNGVVPGSYTSGRHKILPLKGIAAAAEVSRQDATVTVGCKRFKGACFHCGVKGHSQRFCPLK